MRNFLCFASQLLWDVIDAKAAVFKRYLQATRLHAHRVADRHHAHGRNGRFGLARSRRLNAQPRHQPNTRRPNRRPTNRACAVALRPRPRDSSAQHQRRWLGLGRANLAHHTSRQHPYGRRQRRGPVGSCVDTQRRPLVALAVARASKQTKHARSMDARRALGQKRRCR